jgi:septal ring factor EnvC (AmiA/AmiB activator)
MRALLILPFLAACATSENPADGGLVSGVRNLSDGTYERRIEEREARVEAERAETAALEGERDAVAAETARIEAEIARTEGELATARRDLVRLRYEAESRGREIPPEVEAKVVAVTTAKAEEPDPAARLESLRRTLADTRALAETLAQLSG